MRSFRIFAFAMVLGIAALGLMPSSAKALVIYSYAGNNFDSITDNTLPAGSYDTTMSVSGSFTVAAPLLSLPSNTDIRALLLSYSFFDGRQTLDNGNSQSLTFRLSTDAAGSPSSWSILVAVPFAPTPIVGDFIRSITTFAVGSVGLARGRISECLSLVAGGSRCATGTDRGQSNFVTGVWTVQTIPEPSTLLLFGFGLAGLAGFARKRSQG